MSGPSRLLFVTSNRIGDAVLSTGVLAALLRDLPEDCRVTVACGPVATGLFEDLPQLERILPMAKRKRAGHWRTLWRHCIGTRWDCVADLRDSLFPLTVFSKKRLFLRGEKRHEHRITELQRQLRLSEPPAPVLWISPQRQARMAAVIGTGPVLAIGPTANWGGKQWPADRFAAAALQLTAENGPWPGAKIAVLGAPQERAMAEPLFAQLPPDRLIDLTGGGPLLDACAALRCCQFYLGNDSGLMHMAAAVGVPTLGLFGPSPEWRYHPWGDHAAWCRTRESFEQIISAPDYDYRKSDSRMMSLPVETVVAAARDLANRCASRSIAD